MLHRPSPSMVVACVALAVALGGTGYAATQLPPRSVGREQLRNDAVLGRHIHDGAVTAAKIGAGAITSSKVRNGAIRRRDLANDVLPPAPTTEVVQASGEAVAPGQVGAVSASCPAGRRATGGGGGFAGPPTTNDKVVDSIPVGDERPVVRWRVSLVNGGTEPRTPVAYVICAAP